MQSRLHFSSEKLLILRVLDNTLVENPARILYFVGSYTGSWQDRSRILAGLHNRKRLVGSCKLKDPIRDAKLIRLLCNSFVLSRIKSIFGMEVL